ncbi:MAG: glycosyltransferase family 2 protein [Bacteroidota bacterium]
MHKLSVVIITLNEERNITRCLSSVKEVADDIVVVDSGSTDRTREICSQSDVNFIFHPWTGYSDQKNYANRQACYDWILSIDADEELSPELIQSIKEAKNKTQIGYYKINRLTNYCGKWIKHGGWYPDIKLRIFDRNNTQWECAIHEILTNEKKFPSVLLKGNCYHYTYYNITEHIAQANKFSELSAQDMFQRGKKYGFIKLFISPLAKFIGNYVMRTGFLDGIYGLAIACISAQAVFWKYAKLKQMNRSYNKQ